MSVHTYTNVTLNAKLLTQTIPSLSACFIGIIKTYGFWYIFRNCPWKHVEREKNISTLCNIGNWKLFHKSEKISSWKRRLSGTKSKFPSDFTYVDRLLLRSLQLSSTMCWSVTWNTQRFVVVIKSVIIIIIIIIIIIKSLIHRMSDLHSWIKLIEDCFFSAFFFYTTNSAC